MKRHIVADTAGLLLLESAKGQCPGIARVWPDRGSTGPATREPAAKSGIDIEIVPGPKPPPGTLFVVQPRRRAAGRTRARINRNRRMVRSGESHPRSPP